MFGRSATIAALAAAALGGTALAQPGGSASRFRPPAARADAAEQARGLFAMLDRNGDGAITGDELPTPRGAGGAAPPAGRGMRGLFARADKDGDGRVTRAEAEAAALARFDAADTDKDGKLSDKEREAARPRRNTPVE